MKKTKCTNKERPNITFETISSWKTLASDDLFVAKLNEVPTFIRTFHAEQAIEKLLKAVLIISAGTFNNSGVISDCGWLLNEGVKIPRNHKLIELCNTINKHSKFTFTPFNDKQKKCLEELTECANIYRYPHLLNEKSIPVSFPDVDVETLLFETEQLYDSLYDYICNKAQN